MSSNNLNKNDVVDLSVSRARIDEIDKQIIDLFEQRMKIAADVAAFKRATGKPVLDKQREAEKIEAARAYATSEFKQFIPPLLSMVMEMSRAYQHSLLDDDNASCLPSKIKRLPKLPSDAQVVLQGAQGAYQHIACKELFDNPQIQFVPTFDAVVDALDASAAQFGILPLENSTAGTVDRVYDLLYRRGMTIVAGITLRINHDLLAKPGTKLSDVNEIFSHEQALRQCADFIEQLPGEVTATECRNTAMAARAIAQSERLDVAAISSSECANLYNLEVLQHAIQDEQNNFTRFICITKHPVLVGEPNRTSLLLTLPHEPGALFRVLSRIAALGANLLKLESRPIPGSEFEFMFYVDVQAAYGDGLLEQVITQIQPLCDKLAFLGSYSEISA